ncbi:hypothetical protein Mapa_018632 [Marchantia paleacea]|nr:hypothetical protein Mapa_018632 [Marchantia paleacea]
MNILNPYYTKDIFLAKSKVRFSLRKLSIKMFIQLSVITSGLLYNSLFIEILNNGT